MDYRDGRLVLRFVTEEDLGEVARTWPSDHHPLSESEARDTIAYMAGNHAKNETGSLWHLCLAVCSAEDPGTIMGWCGLDGRRSRTEPEIFILLDEPYRNRGYGTQCVKRLLRIAAEDFSLPGVHGGCAKENIASRRAMEKGGMVQYGSEENGDPLFRFCPGTETKKQGKGERETMDRFTDALLSGKTDKIPEEYDWFAKLVGDWDCVYTDELIDGKRRYVKGEWIFRRVLEGVGIQDIFIFPSRETREENPQPDAEYGTSLRIFNRMNRCYDVVYTCAGTMKRLTFRKENGELAGKVLDEKDTYWIFSDITDDSFHWEYVTVKNDGTRELVCEVFGKKQDP